MVLLAAGLSTAQGFAAGEVWSVIAPTTLDPRIKVQLSGLAAQYHAELSTFATPREAGRRRVKLLIELVQAGSLNSFLQTLNRQAVNSRPVPTTDLARDGYIMSCNYHHAQSSLRPHKVRVTAADARGFHYALLRFPELLRHDPPQLLAKELAPPPKSVSMLHSRGTVLVRVTDFPSFPERGVVEGFYGTPWSHQDRLDILRFEGKQRMNVYYYAPKDDPYHRKLWRDPYPAGQMSQLGELVTTARSNFVDFCFAVSPGLSMAYSSDEDFTKLTTKLESVGKLGVSCFALFLDDVPPELQSPQDQARFNTLAQAHIHLINKLYHYLRSQSVAGSESPRLTVTPTTYTNAWGSQDYIRALGAGVDPHVDLVWTGPEVVSRRITVAQARAWGALLRRKPLVWDNFPVNDGIPWRLNLGPMRGRDPNLPSAVRGLVSNPMNQAHASMIALQTIAEYLWNSGPYIPQRAYSRALTDQYGKDAPKLLAPFLEAYGDYWWQENVFKPLWVEERIEVDVPRMERTLASLQSSLQSLSGQARFQELWPDLSPFSVKTRERLAQVNGDPAFQHLPGGRLLWHDSYDVLHAARTTQAPRLDGDFAKWQRGLVHGLQSASQLLSGSKFWQGPEQFSARVALGWDEQYFYVGVDVIDPTLYQPFTGRGINEGDVFILMLETAFHKNFNRTSTDGDEYRLLFSSGNFAGVEASLFSDEDYLPPRPHPWDYHREIKTAWKKTAAGYSGDIAIPVSFFDGGRFQAGYEIGVGFAAQKVLLTPPGRANALENGGDDNGTARIVLGSKADPLFPVSFGNPSSYQRLILVDAESSYGE